MSSITILDNLNVEIVSATPPATTGLARYLKGPAAKLVAGVDVARQLQAPLRLARSGESGLSLSWSGNVPLGHDGLTLAISAGSRSIVGVYNQVGMDLLEDTFVGPPLKVADGRSFLSFSLHSTVEATSDQQAGSLTFGLTAGAESELRCYRPFDTTSDEVTLATACRDVLEHFVIPRTAADLVNMKELPAGTLACLTANGRMRIGATVTVAPALNPLASLNTLPKVGALNVGPAVTASVGVTAIVSGEFQIRVQRLEGAVVRLGYHTQVGRGLDVTLGASASAGVMLGERDLLKMLPAGNGGNETTETDLRQGGLTAPQIERVQAAMTAALSRRMEVAVSAQFSSLKQDEAAFLYEIDLDRLDAAGATALDRALAFDLTAVNALESDPAAHGISVLQSRTQALRRTGVSWRINLVGLVNVLSMTELVRSGDIVHDAESGDLVITDAITKDRVGAITDRKQIRKLLYESSLMTLTYKASGLDVNTQFNASQNFFFLDHDANRQRMSDYLDAVAALGLLDSHEIPGRLADQDDFGRASLMLEATFDQPACERLFQPLDAPAGAVSSPPDQSAYERIGRKALLALVKPTDPDAYRRVPLADDGIWKAMRESGQPGFRFILPVSVTGGSGASQSSRIGVVTVDYNTIVWWAGAMAVAAARVAEMKAFLKARPASTGLDSDPEFRARREHLEQSMVKAISRNTSTFDDPWGLVALFMASAGSARVSATVVSAPLTLALPDPARA